MGWLSGRSGIVTGASRGIGLACAQALARAGMRTVLAARDAGAIERAAAELCDEGHDARAVPTDVSIESDVVRLFDDAGDVDGLVCAAGILEKAAIAGMSTESWSRTLATNLTGVFLCSRAAFGAMSQGGRIITFGSLSGVYATEKFPGLTAYNVSKYGVVGLTEMLAVEGRELGISAVCISPGAVDTQMLRDAAPHLVAGLTPDDVGRLVVDLLDGDITPLSGANLPLFSNR